MNIVRILGVVGVCISAAIYAGDAASTEGNTQPIVIAAPVPSVMTRVAAVEMSSPNRDEKRKKHHTYPGAVIDISGSNKPCNSPYLYLAPMSNEMRARILGSHSPR